MPYKDPEKERAYRAAYYKANLEKLKERSLQNQRANPDRRKAYDRTYRERHRDKENARKKSWRKANPERVKASNLAYKKANPAKSISLWKKANPEKAKAAATAGRKANPEKYNIKMRLWREANPMTVKKWNARKYHPFLPEKLLAIIALKNMIREEIRKQTKPTKTKPT